MRKIEDLQCKLSEGRITRRDFIQQMTALGVAGAVPSLVLMEEARAAAPKRGGKLRQALRGGSTNNTLAGSSLVEVHDSNTSWQIRNNLVEVTAEGNLAGELAESWESTPDAAEWRFKLRKGVEFHNGKSLEPADVIHSINVHRGEDSTSGGAGAVANVTDIKADGKDTVVFSLAEGSADFPFLMSDYHLIIGPDGTEGSQWDEGVGTGPFMLTHWEPGVRSASKRNPNYFKEGLPYFDEVESLNVNDQSARINALKTDEVDAIAAPDLKTLHLLEKSGVKILEAAGTKHYSIPMRTDTAPYDNNDVRMALKHAIDREAILETILRGHGAIGNDHPIGPNQLYYAGNIPQREYDLDKARFHLKQAGLSKLTVQLHTADIFAAANDAAVLYKEHAAPAGIDIEVVREAADGYWSAVWMVKPFSMCWWSGRATEDWMFSIAYAEGASWNDSFWSHERFNQLLKQARAELDSEKRREMYTEMQLIVRDEGGVVIPVFANFVAAASAKIGTPEEIGGNWPMDGAKNFERWWFV